MSLRVVQFLAVVFTALAFVPAAAHLFDLPNKIDGIVNLSKSGLSEGVMTRPKSLKVRRAPWVRILQKRVNPVKLTVPAVQAGQKQTCCLRKYP